MSSAAVILPLLVLPFSASPFHSAKLAFLSIVVSIAATAAFFTMRRMDGALPTGSGPELRNIIFITLLLSAISTLTSSVPMVSAQTASCIAGFCLIVYICTLSSPGILIHAVALGMIIPSFIALAQSQDFLKWFPEKSIYSTLGNQNTLSIWLAAGLPFCLGVLQIRSNPVFRILSLFSLAIAAVILYLCNVQGSWLATGAAVFVFFAFPSLVGLAHRSRKVIATLVPAILVGANVAALSIASTIDFKDKDYSVFTRMVHAMDTFEMGVSRPFFGWGAGTFMTNFPQFQTHQFGFEMLKAHQEYFQLFAETGLLGILALSFVIYSLTMALLNSPPSRLAAARTAAAALAATAVTSFASFPMHDPSSALIAAIAAGIALGHRTPPLTTPDKAATARPPWQRAWITVPLFLTAVALWQAWSIAPFISEVNIKKGLAFEIKRQGPEARACYLESVKWNPANGYANFLAGGSFAITGDYDTALDYLNRASRLRDFGSLHYIKGYIYYHKEEYKRAEYEFIRAKDRGFVMKRPE